MGPRSWHHYGREEEWRAALNELAVVLLSDENTFRAELDWLLSTSAASAFEFGQALGSRDAAGTYLDQILTTSEGQEIGFARGYVSGLVFGAKADPITLNARLDSLESRDPSFAFQIALAGGDALNVFDRAVRLITEEKLPAFHLRNFTHWIGDRRVSNDEVLLAISLLLSRAKAGDVISSDVIVDFLGYRLHSKAFPEILSSNAGLIWEALAAATEHPGRETFWWMEVLAAAAPNNLLLAVKLACDAIVSDNFELSDEAL